MTTSATTEKVLELQIVSIRRDPDLQVRFQENREGKILDLPVEDLIKDIFDNGLLFPVVVIPENSRNGTSYLLIDGHRRIIALEALGQVEVKAIVLDSSKDDALQYAFSTNFQRQTLKPLDIARAIFLAKDRGWSTEEIKERFGLERTQQERYEQLLSCPKDVITALADGKIKMAHALAILDAAGGDSKQTREILSSVTKAGVSAHEISEKVSKEVSRRKERAPLLSIKGDQHSIRTFSFSTDKSKEHLQWLRGQIRGIIKEIDSIHVPTGDTPDYVYVASTEEYAAIRIKPGNDADGKSIDKAIENRAKKERWNLVCLDPKILGTPKPLEVYRTHRKGDPIKSPEPVNDKELYCPATWADIRIGRGACGLRCRTCFLIMTHRTFCDPTRHVLYDDVDADVEAVRQWLLDPTRLSIGLGIDCSDSLLYEGITGHARKLIPIFADPKTNPLDRKLVLLTKTANVHFLEGLPTENVYLTFSLNPEEVADLWEGKFPDGTRVTPPISKRLEASLKGQKMGFEIRWRVDPVLPVPGYEEIYEKFFKAAAKQGHRPTMITLGSYRETSAGLRTFSKAWGLPEAEWEPEEELLQDGSHLHLSEKLRITIYRTLAKQIRSAWPKPENQPMVALCKEPRAIREKAGITCSMCNCR